MESESMESDILESLEDLGYKGPLLEDGALIHSASGGAASPEFTKLCAWLVSELKLFCKLEENVQATNSPSEAEGFQLEVSGLLAEMNCPYTSLTSGDVTKRLLVKRNCLLLLTYLISELEAARMLCVNNPPKSIQAGGGGGSSSKGSEVFQELKGICISLGMSKPPATITMLQFFSGIEKKLKEVLSKVPPNHVGKPLLSKQLGPSHWEKIEAINQAIANEYEVRRKMLVKRLDVTVQSFGWSDRAKSRSDKLGLVYQPKRAALANKSVISVAHLLAARQDLSKILRTSSGSIREKTTCAVNKVLMGRVPDRGGRPNEIEPPPPEMPPWQKRQDGPQQQGGGRGGGRGGYEQSYGGRGGYDQGGGRGGHDQGGGRGGGRGGYDYGGRGRGNKVQGGWTDSGGGSYQDGGYRDAGFQTGGYHGGGGGGGGSSYQSGGGGGYQGGGYQGGNYGGYQASSYSGSGYQSSGYQQDNRYQDGGHHSDRGGGGRGRGGRGGRGGRAGQGGGWGGRGGQNYNQGGQFEQHFQHGGYQYNQSGFGQGRHYTS
ncbi:protein FAM98A [Rhinatrema bivittatum]|uniref:protein FAM98A n=1 Tax=Rhinatrema bivittatum TaxID=194408 RepID=UPI00112DD2AF|nr:protein FAM98A [Rhinatrema bivittatum]